MNILGPRGRSVLGTNLRAVALPLLFLAVLIILIVFVVNTGFKKVSEVRSKLTESKRQEATLTSKLETLQRGEESFKAFSDLSAVAIPEKNPAAVVSSQVKTLAASAGVVIGRIAIQGSGGSGEGPKEMGVEIIAQGELAGVLSFLASLNSFLPLTEISEVSFSQSEGQVGAQAKITSFFAPFPESLPTLTSPISDLTQEEKDLLGRFAGYSQPIFSYAEVSPGGPYQRADLFNF
jgi:hypothetical protein